MNEQKITEGKGDRRKSTLDFWVHVITFDMHRKMAFHCKLSFQTCRDDTATLLAIELIYS